MTTLMTTYPGYPPGIWVSVKIESICYCSSSWVDANFADQRQLGTIVSFSVGTFTKKPWDKMK